MKQIILAIIALLIALPAQAAEKESVYDRVMHTGVMRCAYIVYPPETIKDPNTGALSGTVVETIEALGKQLDLKIEWTEEVPFTHMFEGLYSGRHDALCSGLFENPQRAKRALFSVPSNYGVTYAFARSDDTRFDDSLTAVNSPDITIAVIDGELAQSIAAEMFPDAKTYALPQLTDISMVLESVATKKADVAFLQKAPGRRFIEANPGKIKTIGKEPIRAYPAPPLAFHPDEIKLKLLFDVGIRTLLLNGTIENILRKYDPELDSYRLIAKPYEAAE
ncbi:MAG: transporter substrate-binding domain-containing protein [Rhodospirillales bacterium]|nr:transporter substrate-binding domain-containing protein [Rhodospirillales bacterium]